MINISPLHVEGRYINDHFNNTVILRGVNQEGFLDSPNGWWNPEGGGTYSGLGIWNPDAVKYNLDSMKSWGCNALRLHTKIAWWLNDESSYRQHIKDVIAWAGERGIYVIFEPYSVSTATQYPLPWAPHTTDPEEQAMMPDSSSFISYWTSVANELKTFPNVIFEIYNEPHGDLATRDEFFSVTQQWIDAVRATGAEQLLIVQWGYGIWINLAFPPPPPPEPSPTASSGTMDWVLLFPLNDPLGNIVYSFHNYRGDFHRTVPERVNVWEYDDIKQALQHAWVDYVLNTLDKPVLVGEIGANMWASGEGLDQELAYFNNSLTIYNEWNMSYVAWVWTVPAHMQHGLLQNGAPWLPPPNAAGEILVSKMRE
ncbi:MAG: glycoside hydrolase family 5 protein [Candidatus Helarchaeota archaeon]